MDILMIPPTIRSAFARKVFSTIIFFGIVLVFITPPIQSPDEDSHFVRIAMLSAGSIFPTYEEGRWGQRIPQSLRDYVAAHKYMSGHPETKYSYRSWYVDSYAAISREPSVHYTYPSQSASPLLYLPQIAGLLAGKALYRIAPSANIRFNWSAALYFARLGNLIAFAVGVTIALQWLLSFRSIITFVATMPMSVFLASTASYDTTVILSAIGFFALTVVGSGLGKPPSNRLKVAIVVAAFFLGHAKAVYLPVLLTIILLRHVMRKREFIVYSFLVLLAGLMGAASALFLFGFTSDPMDAPLLRAQQTYLATHPLAVPRLIWNTLVTRFDFYLVSFFGDFGWLDTNLPLPAIALLSGLFLAAIAVDAMQLKPHDMHLVDRLVIFLGCAASIIMMMLALYVIWTSKQPAGVGAPLVDGPQGRYFIPLAPFLACVFAILPRAIIHRSGSIPISFLELQLSAARAMLALACFSLLVRYWIPNPP
ncbi:DUF2142 domain-containing protein [Bradyrhizobium sp. USDA 4502]